MPSEHSESQYYARYAGKTRINEAVCDELENPAGNEYDLGKDNAFSRFTAMIVPTCPDSVHERCSQLLSEKGLNVLHNRTLQNSLSSFEYGDIEATVFDMLKQIDVLWIYPFDDRVKNRPFFSDNLIEGILGFHKRGGGIYVNVIDPNIVGLNKLLVELVGGQIARNPSPKLKLIKVGEELRSGTFLPHMITTGLTNMVDYSPPALYISQIGKLTCLAKVAEERCSIGYFDGAQDSGRIVVDCFTMNDWRFGSGKRLIKNSIVWCLGADKQLIESADNPKQNIKTNSPSWQSLFRQAYNDEGGNK